jgi:hypothetical protein
MIARYRQAFFQPSFTALHPSQHYGELILGQHFGSPHLILEALVGFAVHALRPLREWRRPPWVSVEAHADLISTA